MHPRNCLFYAFASLFLFSHSTSAFRRKSQQVFRAMGGDNDSSALRELKETIKNQKKEIESLKKQIKGSTVTAGTSHGGHGGGGEESPDELAAYLKSPFYRIAAKRTGWLGIFLVSLSFTALIIEGFEHTLERQIELAYFVPMLAGFGGNVGGQTVGTVLSSLSAGVVKPKDAPRVISKEAMSGLFAGSLLGISVGVVAHYVMNISAHVSTVVMCTMPLVATIAGTLGSSIPFLCIICGLDPSVIAAPAMTSFVDVLGLMSYFLIANQVFALFGIEM